MQNHLVWIVLDSCRYDSFVAAKTPHMSRLGNTEKRYSYASWTSPSHFAMLMGLLPHTSPQHIFASEVYKAEYAKWENRLGINGLSFKTFVPTLWFPKVLQDHGYKTSARVSMPVLNPFTPLNRNFDDYRLMQNHFDLRGIIDSIQPVSAQPQFYFLNVGETHYPYMLDPKSLPHVSGVHGVLKRLDDDLGSTDEFFSLEDMERLRLQQIRCVEYVDKLMGELMAKMPPNTHYIITADHGELFGEDGYFGHGPIMHPKVFEVPFLEGRLAPE